MKLQNGTDEVEVVDEGTRGRVRVREPSGKASAFLTPIELDAHGMECIRLAERLRGRGVDLHRGYREHADAAAVAIGNGPSAIIHSESVAGLKPGAPECFDLVEQAGTIVPMPQFVFYVRHPATKDQICPSCLANIERWMRG